MKDFIELTFVNGEKMTVSYSIIEGVKQSIDGCIVTLKDGKTIHAINPYLSVVDFLRREEK